MKKITLTRFLDDGKKTLGYLEVPDLKHKLWTLELPWKDNKRKESCIPTGLYQVKSHISGRHGESYFLTNVKGREEILIHRGNVVSDSTGCLLIGLGIANIKEEDAVINSAAALQLLKLSLKEEFILEIRNARNIL